MRAAVASGEGSDAVLAQKRAGVRAGVRSTLGLWIDGEWFEEDDLEQAVIDRVIYALRDLAKG